MLLLIVIIIIVVIVIITLIVIVIIILTDLDAFTIDTNHDHPVELQDNVALTCVCDSVPNGITGCTSDSIIEYTWYKDDVEIPSASGMDKRTYNLPDNKRGDTAVYKCRITTSKYDGTTHAAALRKEASIQVNFLCKFYLKLVGNQVLIII